MAQKKSKERPEGRSLLFFVPYFSTRLDFTSPPLSVPGSPRMRHLMKFTQISIPYRFHTIYPQYWGNRSHEEYYVV